MRRHTKPARPCEQCGKPFQPRTDHLKNGFGRFCSRHCGDIHRRIPPEKRFWARVNKDGPIPADPTLGNCWVWTGPTASNRGYGSFGERHGDSEPAHRWSYRNHVGPIPAGLFVCHKCDNRACIRPSHLFVGTVNDNNQDMLQKGRYARGEQGPHKLTELQVIEARQSVHRGESQSSIAKRMGVTSGAINCIIKGKTWMHVQ